MTPRGKLFTDCTGAAALEFALVAPVFILLLSGIFQMGMALHARAGLRNGVESAARYAQIYPRPTDSQIVSMLRSSAFGLDPTRLNTPTVTHGTKSGLDYVDISATYNYRMNIVMMPSTTLPLSYSHRAYQY